MRKRTGLAIAALAATLTLTLAACAQLEPTTPAAPTTAPSAAPSTDPAAAWLDGGRGIALVTWGSSSIACAPAVADVQAEGQTVSVTLAGPAADIVCTADFAPRGTYVAVPQGVDPTKDVALSFQGDTFGGRVPLAGNSAIDGGSKTEGKPSAGWFAPDGIVLLTWGSSTCPPVIEKLVEAKSGATVTFATDATKVCTRDFVPRLTVLGVTTPADPAGYTLTLTGDHLDGEVPVIG
ncbi:hypothetical protein [Microbacterium panaciterrae]|uniref:Uncharacterized protein n=1 Tax=Microbacterium panaciterrae TaxID=985759 RepID=A0ABP8P683_9MICO